MGGGGGAVGEGGEGGLGLVGGGGLDHWDDIPYSKNPYRIAPLLDQQIP